MTDPILNIELIRDSSDALLRAMETFRSDSPGDLKDTVDAYSQIAEAANDRLRSAHSLLRQGRTAEALHACEAEPNILDCVTELDTADQAVDAWRATLEEAGITCPERLLSDVAEELNAAYDVQHQIASLMRNHRLLAIARGSLEDRVTTLRAIANLNPENPVWIEDLVTYEQQCRTDLEGELSSLGRIEAADVTEAVVARARKIVKQLSDSSWQEPLPAHLVHHAESILNDLRANVARQELESLAERMVTAHAAADVEEAKSLCERWEKCCKRARLPSESPLSERTRECRDWLQVVIAERNALADLRSSMEKVSIACSLPTPWTPWHSRSVREQLHAAVHEMESRQIDAPPCDDAVALSVAARGRLKKLDRVPPLFYTMAGVLGVIVAAGVFRVGSGVQRSIQIARVTTKLRDDIARFEKEELFADAQLTWRKALDRHPWLSTQTISSDMTRKFAGWKDSADACIDRASDLLEHCRRELSEAIPNDIETLDKACTATGAIPRVAFDAKASVADKLTFIQRRLDEAKSELDSAENKLEKEAVADLRSRARGLSDEVVAVKRESRLKAKAVEDAQLILLQSEAKRLASMKDLELSARKGDIDALRGRIEDLSRFADGNAEGLRTDLAKLDERVGNEQGRQELRKRINEAAERGLDDFMKALVEEKSRLSEAEIKSVGEVEAAKPCTEAALAWSEVGEAWLPELRGKKAETDSLRDAIVRARALVLQPTTDEASGERLDTVLAVLEEQDKDGSKSLQPLSDYLMSPALQPDVLQVTVDNQIFYTRAREKSEGGYFYDENSINPKSRRRVSIESAETQKAPHVDWAAGLRADIDAIRDGGLSVEKGILKMIQTCADPVAENVDPLLVCRILAMLTDAAESKVMLADVESISALGDNIGSGIGVTPLWIDPTKRRAASEAVARKAINRREISQAVSDGRKEVDSIVTMPAFCRGLLFAGWAEKHGEGITLHMRRKFASDGIGAAYAILAKGDSAWNLFEVARLADGKATVTKAGVLGFGRPLFVEANRRTKAAIEGHR